MEKYLFTDGSSGVKELQSDEELTNLLRSIPDTSKVSIWIFNTHEWISHAEYLRRKKAPLRSVIITGEKKQSTSSRKFRGIQQLVFCILAATAVFLIYNFTRIKWQSLPPLRVTAARPANAPLVNTDSLIELIEFVRGQKLDKVTRTNLRIRNNWPDRLFLHLDAVRDSSHVGIQYSAIRVTLDNATGYQVDEALVKLAVWKNGRVSQTDTIRFEKFGYTSPVVQSISKDLRGDSLSIDFLSIRSRAFNFCYSSEKKSNYGNLADRWFCKE